MVNYANGKIYCIRNYLDDEIYVGSTCNTLGRRMSGHREDCKKAKSSRLYDHMKKLGVSAFYIELLEPFPCENIEQLNARESHYVREMGTLNSRLPGAYAQAGGGKAYRALYAQMNQERIAQRDRCPVVCDVCGTTITKNKLSRHKETPKCRLQEPIKGEVVECNVCNCVVSKKHLARHKKSKKCQSHASHS
jgi:group I intron endonuclease